MSKTTVTDKDLLKVQGASCGGDDYVCTRPVWRLARFQADVLTVDTAEE